MDYFHKFRSTVTQVAAQVSNALPGNPLTREYEVKDQIATAGPGLLWKVFNGRKQSTNQAVAVWLFEKKEMDRWSKEEREEFIAIIKLAAHDKTMQKLLSKRVRKATGDASEGSEPVNTDSLVFCTEPIFASLANLLGRHENFTHNSIPQSYSQFELNDIEVKHGLLQVAEALAFLHNDARMLHRNISPESVIVNVKGAWKLGGFDFSIQGTPSTNNQVTFEAFDYNDGKMEVAQPVLEYLAPEYALGGKADSYADIFSLGILTFAVFNKGAAPVKYRGKLDSLKKSADKFKSVPEVFMANIPFVFRDDYKMCLNYTPDLRPDAYQFTKIAFFDDPLVKTLNYFESLMQMDNQQKMAFFKGLTQVIPKFEKRILLMKVFPYLTGEFSTPDLIPFILPSIFLIAEQADKTEFTKCIMPSIVPVFSLQKPYQIVLLLLQKMELFLAKATEDDIKKHVLPLIYNAIGSDTTRIQELCLAIIPTIGHLVDRQSMKTQLLPKLLKLAMEGSVVALRVQALMCLGKLLPTLEPWMVTEQVLPVLPRITSKEPGMLMCILGIYKLSFESDKIGMGREQLAKSALPFLVSTLVENTLNLQQFEQFAALVKEMLARVEKEQRSRLQQLSAGEEAQRSVPSFNSVLTEATISDKKISPDLADLIGSSSATAKASSNVGGALSLEDKKRLAAEQNRGTPSSNGTSSGSAPLPPSKISSIGGSAPFSSSNPTSSSFDPFDTLLKPSSSSVKTTGPAFDVNDFLPQTSSSTAPSFPSSSSSAFPSLVPPPSNPLAPPLGGLSYSSSSSVSNSLFLPKPPMSSNAPIQKTSSTSSNPLDSLFSFPSHKSQPMNSLSSSIAPSPSMQGRSTVTAALTPQVKQQPLSKDPFADLLG